MIDTKQEELSSFIHSLCEKEEIDVSLDYINYVLDDLMPMTRSNEEVLNSFHITKDMKEIIISNIEDIKSLSDEGLLDNFFSLDVKSRELDELQNENGYDEDVYNSITIINSLLVIIINEFVEKINK